MTFVTLLLLWVAPSWADKEGKRLSTPVLECSKVGAQPLSARTERVTNAKKSNDAYAVVELARDPADPSGASCVATYTLYLSQYSSNFKPVKTFSTPTRDGVGVDLLGFSDNGSKVAADFWWQTGDYKGHRSVVYDLKSKVPRMDELSDQITSQLPACAYQEELTGVTDKGEVVIHVPSSVHVDRGCPDQGNWLLDSTTGEVRREQ
jgi:hypothetical protein